MQDFCISCIFPVSQFHKKARLSTEEVPTMVQKRRGQRIEFSFLAFQFFRAHKKHYFLVAQEILQIAKRSLFALSRGREGSRRPPFSCLRAKTTTQLTNQAPNPVNYRVSGSVDAKTNLSKFGVKPDDFPSLRLWFVARTAFSNFRILQHAFPLILHIWRR